ncbi:hypothetical protein GCM10010174_65580 [Kutzneria viridogrisea]
MEYFGWRTHLDTLASVPPLVVFFEPMRITLPPSQWAAVSTHCLATRVPLHHMSEPLVPTTAVQDGAVVTGLPPTMLGLAVLVGLAAAGTPATAMAAAAMATPTGREMRFIVPPPVQGFCERVGCSR